MVTWFSTRVPRPFNGERVVFSTDGTRTTGYPQAKDEVGPVPHTMHVN